MADYILITPEKLKGESIKVREYRQQHVDTMSRFNNLVLNLSESWHGEAQQTFVAKYQGMKDKFNKFDEALEKYAVDMDETADIMQETDQSLASKLTVLHIRCADAFIIKFTKEVILMARIQVTPEVLNEKSNEVRKYKGRAYKHFIQKLTAMVNAYWGWWQGDAQAAFQAKFDGIEECTFTQFEQILEVCVKLLVMLQKHMQKRSKCNSRDLVAQNYIRFHCGSTILLLCLP